MPKHSGCWVSRAGPLHETDAERTPRTILACGLVNTDLKSSGQRPAGVALLITVGRLCFSIATICAFTHLFFEWPAQFLHIAIGLAAAMVLLLLAAFLLRVF